MSDDSDRRLELRAPIVLKVEYKRLNTFFYDYTKNISKGGIFIKTRKPLTVGTSFLFKLFVPGLADPLDLRGEVRWTRKSGRGGKDRDRDRSEDNEPGMGIRLIYDDDEQRRDVDRVVEKLMVQSLGPLIYAHLKTSAGEPDG
jgi:type IV pilus assembly protein PilZ